MRRCASNTKAGRRCLNRTLAGADRCAVHRSESSGRAALAVGVGALVGNAIVPGLGGLVLGGIAGQVVKGLLEHQQMGKSRVFVSFDFDNYRALKDFILGLGLWP